jgi:hypothetical protein
LWAEGLKLKKADFQTCIFSNSPDDQNQVE